MFELLPADWQAALADELTKPYIATLTAFVAAERAAHTIFPPAEDMFTAFRLTPYDNVRVVILGQDPYHDDGQAHGLAFSVRPGHTPPPSLKNMFSELQSDLGVAKPATGSLVGWAEQGVLLLNAVLTVRAHTPNSHKGQGWEQFTDAVIRAVDRRPAPAVFVLWGKYAQQKAKLIDGARHTVLQGAHPSPLSARSGFFGSKPYSQINAALQAAGTAPIDWDLAA